MAVANPADRRHREHGARALLLQRPQIGAVVDAVRRYRVTVAVPGEEDRLVPGDLAEHQRGRRLPVRRANDLAVPDRERREAGQAGTADDGEHGTCYERGLVVGGVTREPHGRRDSPGEAGLAGYRSRGTHDIIITGCHGADAGFGAF